MLALLLSSAAFAANYQVTFCAEYSIDFDDADVAVGDDYFTSNTDRPARGARIKIVRNSDGFIMFDNYTDWDGAAVGCTSALTLDSTKTYQVMVQSRALVNGNYVFIYDDPTTPSYWAFEAYAAYAPTSSTTVTFDTTLTDHWNTAAAMGFGLYRRTAGLSGETFTVYMEPCPSGGGSCRSGNAVYIDSPADSKTVINHELGHYVAFHKNNDNSADTNDGATLNNCYTVSSRNHEAVSKEYQSIAANEGYAHYYAVVSFNDTTEYDCGFAYYKTTDWNLDGILDGQWVSCESGPMTGVDGADYLGDTCTGTLTNRGTEYDWLRFLWDLDTNGGVSTTTIFQIYENAYPHTWVAYGDSTGSGYPSSRLRNGADAAGVLTEWDAWDNYNGVHR
ncbi:MAG: hypothetical protein ACOZNI_19895 [Myxococcota bacterium]